MYALKYQKPVTLPDALKSVEGDAKFLAGGQSLIQAMKLRMTSSSTLVDISKLSELKGISVSDNAVTVGAMTRHAEVALSVQIQQSIPALAKLAHGIGDPMVRNMGTLGGSLAYADPAACYPSALLALAGTVQTNERTISADNFFVNLYETCLKPGELIQSVSFQRPLQAAYIKFKHPASRLAMVGVFVARYKAEVRVGVTGCKTYAFRATQLEKLLSQKFSPDVIEGVELPWSDMLSDIHAGAQYRAALITILAARAVEQCLAS